MVAFNLRRFATHANFEIYGWLWIVVRYHKEHRRTYFIVDNHRNEVSSLIILFYILLWGVVGGVPAAILKFVYKRQFDLKMVIIIAAASVVACNVVQALLYGGLPSIISVGGILSAAITCAIAFFLLFDKGK